MRRIGLWLAVLASLLLVTAPARPEASGQEATTQTTGISTDEQYYKGQLSTWLEIIGSSLVRHNDLLLDPEPQDDEWVQDVIGEGHVWKAVYEHARNVEAPPAYADGHELLVESFRKLDQAADAYRSGMTKNRDADIERANGYVEESSELLVQAWLAINDLSLDE